MGWRLSCRTSKQGFLFSLDEPRAFVSGHMKRQGPQPKRLASYFSRKYSLNRIALIFSGTSRATPFVYQDKMSVWGSTLTLSGRERLEDCNYVRELICYLGDSAA